MAERAKIVYKAKLAEQAERFDDMVACMKKVVELGAELSLEERNLFSVAYKDMVGARRTAWRILSGIEKKKCRIGEEEKMEMTKEYRLSVQEELRDICLDVLQVLDDHIIPAATTSETKVFFYKMKGDYHRYMAEFASGADRVETAEKSLVVYKAASDLAEADLSATHPTRLGLALNFAVFYYENLKSTERACRLAKAALSDAMAEFDTLSEECYKDTTLIMQLLRDNLTLWTPAVVTTTDDSEDKDSEDSPEEEQFQLTNAEDEKA